MRKFLFFLCALLTGGVGPAWAEGISVYIRNAAKVNSYVSSELKCAASKSEATTFTIDEVKTGDATYYSILNNSTNQYVTSTFTQVESLDESCYWNIVYGSANNANDAGFYISPKGNTKDSWN